MTPTKRHSRATREMAAQAIDAAIRDDEATATFYEECASQTPGDAAHAQKCRLTAACLRDLRDQLKEGK